MQKRSQLIRESKQRMHLNRLRIAACDRELAKIGDMSQKSYAVMWHKQLDCYQENLLIRKAIYGRNNWFWILTGIRWRVWEPFKWMWKKFLT